MTTFVLLAPGPSMSQALADRVRAIRDAAHADDTAPPVRVGVVTSAWPLAPWADFLAANDVRWWRKTPEAHAFAGRKYSTNRIGGDIIRLTSPVVTSATNSGVLALEVARQRGASRIVLLGFDMHGTHYFGPYTNGLVNTPDARRAVHVKQYELWRRTFPAVDVVNATPGSALAVFPRVPLDDALAVITPGGACGRAA